ncbi:MAG: protein-L-isoaspartate(D-aspartate) O-methyltransferase [Thermoanaerobaculia bacterium]|nr:protein-L-isoaspartate(D-aspartate) O-methyltransferase [Thermoanaerobaculia bacterium]
MRQELLQEIERDVRSTSHYTGRHRLHRDVLQAMADVPRHEFVPKEWRDSSYINRPLPIGEGQTISQPYIVALMTDLLDPQADDVILDIGTGSGYQAAVLAELVSKVYSMEIVPALAESATDRLERLGYDNVEVRLGNGWQGWPEHAPYDGILVAAGASELPQKLVEQLKPGAKLIVPLVAGPHGEELTVVEKHEDGSVSRRSVLPVRFVPMTGEH